MRSPRHLPSEAPAWQGRGSDACSARERTDAAARRCAAAGQMARAGIEPATPRFSVVDRGATAGHGRRLAAKISLQIASIATIATCGPLSRDAALVRARGRQVDARGAHSARVSADAHEAGRVYPHHVQHSGYLHLRRHASVATTRLRNSQRSHACSGSASAAAHLWANGNPWRSSPTSWPRARSPSRSAK